MKVDILRGCMPMLSRDHKHKSMCPISKNVDAPYKNVFKQCKNYLFIICLNM